MKAILGGWVVLSVITVSSAFVCPAEAQQPRTYAPARSTISPYFQYFQLNTTPLPTYQANVRPQQQLRSDFAGFQSRFSLENRRISLLERAARNRDTAGSVLRVEGRGRAPARAASFQDYQQFYPQQQILPRR